MPKVKIGEKVVAGEKQNVEKKVFTNGHKFFTSAEAKALLETQSREKRTLDRFEANRFSFMKPRNPITGDITPRTLVDSKGDVLERTGTMLFSGPIHKVELENTEKQPNPLMRTDRTNARISSLQTMQDNIGGEIEYLKMKIREKRTIGTTSSGEFRF